MSNPVIDALKISFMSTGYSAEQATKIVEAMFPEQTDEAQFCTGYGFTLYAQRVC